MKQSATTSITPGPKFRHWRIIALDEIGKRATAQCRCGQVREVATADILSGASESCGCRPRSLPHVRAIQAESAERQRKPDFD
jgi:hypothetical protein